MRVSNTTVAGVLLAAGSSLVAFSWLFWLDPRFILRHVTYMIVGSLFLVTAFLLLGMEKIKNEVLREVKAREKQAGSSASAAPSVARLEAR